MDTINEIQTRLLGILRDAVIVRSCIEENPTPLAHDPARYQAEKARLDTAIFVARACCLASGVDERLIDFMTGASVMNLTQDNLERAKNTVYGS